MSSRKVLQIAHETVLRRMLRSTLTPSLKTLRILAGEGNFNLYRQLSAGRRLFLFTKCLLTTLHYFISKGDTASAQNVAYVKGVNQLRYYRHVRTQLDKELGKVQLFVSKSMSDETSSALIPRISIGDVTLQLCYLLLMLVSGKKRYLNLYLLAFAAAVRDSVKIGLNGVNTFICFNDQPFDVAAIVHALNCLGNCRTIVIQHGLILNEKFYFPTVAKEFWAWGELSKKYYRAWSADAKFLIKGRFADDAQFKREQFVWQASRHPINILVAASFHHNEVKSILKRLDLMLTGELKKNICIAIKYHPATKFLTYLRFWCRLNTNISKEETLPMEILADKYDVLVTKNSSSAIDFLLRGKPVFFEHLFVNEQFPSESYGFSLAELKMLQDGQGLQMNQKNLSRLNLLKIALNV